MQIPSECPYKRQCGSIIRALEEDPKLLVDIGLNNDMVDLLTEGSLPIGNCMYSNEGSCVFTLDRTKLSSRSSLITGTALAFIDIAVTLAALGNRFRRQ